MKQKVEHKLVAIEKNEGIGIYYSDLLGLIYVEEDRKMKPDWQKMQLTIQIDGKDVAAYPSKEGLLPISADSIHQYVKANGKCGVWCEMELSNTGLINQDKTSKFQPQLQDGFIYLNLEGGLDFDKLAKSLRDTLANETTESIDNFFDEQDKSEHQPTPTIDWDKLKEELINEEYLRNGDIDFVINFF